MKDKQALFKMIESGVNNLYNHYPQIDKLNVFPVPDGDTGTNMNLTCTNAFSEIDKQDFPSYKELMVKFSRGLIMGARGNSGVIFSQIMKGLSNGMQESEELNIATWKISFLKAKEVAYAAVMKPVEGTILTVIRETSEEIQSLSNELSELEFFEKVCEISNASLERTPDLLPALKEVGVVDSGGFGLVKFFEGITHYLKTGKVLAKSKKLEENHGQNLQMDIEDGEFGYCTEAIVILNDDYIEGLQVNLIREKFEEFGNSSIVAVKDEDILKIHTHALSPGQVLSYLEQFGDFKTIKVENMSIQADAQVAGGNPNIKKQNAHHGDLKPVRTLQNEVATIGVVRSPEMKAYFKDEIGMDYVIDGGPKMNPSTEDFLIAIEKVDAKNVYIFPNDSNVILAASQARDIEEKSKVTIIPTKTISQGIAGFLSFDPDESVKKNETTIKNVIKNVVTFQTSISVIDTELDGVVIKEGQYLGIANKKIVFAGNKMEEVFKKSLSKYISKTTEIITIFSGVEATMKDINDLRKYLDENHDVDYEIIEGGQDTYSFIIGIE